MPKYCLVMSIKVWNEKLKKVGIMQKINEAFIKVGGVLKSDSFSILLHLQKKRAKSLTWAYSL